MGADSSRRFYRGRKRTYEAPLPADDPPQTSSRSQRKNQKRDERKRLHREAEDGTARGLSTEVQTPGAGAISPQARWLLCTGQPGSGKTTLVRKATAVALQHGFRLSGFYTEEVLSGGSRIGFDVVTIPDGKRGILSRKHGLPASYPKTGAYSVDVKEFERLALPSLSATACDVVVIDEIGRMELHSDAFQQEVRRLLDDGTTRLLGAITAPIYGHRVPFCDEVSSVAGVHVEKITKKTRDAGCDKLQSALLAWKE